MEQFLTEHGQVIVSGIMAMFMILILLAAIYTVGQIDVYALYYATANGRKLHLNIKIIQTIIIVNLCLKVKTNFR